MPSPGMFAHQPRLPALAPFGGPRPPRAFADALSHMAQSLAPVTPSGFPAPSPSWWREFATVCHELPHGADVLQALGLSEVDMHTLLTLEEEH